ncbi:MAG: 30S ribosomal protein S13 [Euryarchaeota archaeon]|nr:30S ribosomal protein S13 [Euryarchaeota archaeon]
MSEFRHIIRVAGVDLDGNKKVEIALTKLKGVGSNISQSVVRVLKIDPDAKLGNLEDADIEKIRKALDNPKEINIPSWMLNRRRDYRTGEDKHVIEAELTMAKREDINRLKNISSYRGIRHGLGLPVRGQKTKSSFRTGGSIGVSRKKIKKQREKLRKERD